MVSDTEDASFSQGVDAKNGEKVEEAVVGGEDLRVVRTTSTGKECPNEEEDNVKRSTRDSGLADADNTVDVETMKDAVFFLAPDINRRLSQFWMLILLASLIATTGVAGDSTATVIGAMIVAPLMTPILGTMLSIVLIDGRNFAFSLFLVVSGAGSAILIGYIFGLMSDEATIVKDNNSQVAARVEPKLPDLVGALATGMVGSIALVRKDIAGTLPGVAIAISLVPPLCVSGLAFSTGDTADAFGAMLLFFTNFVSILVMGVIVMYIYKIHLRANRSGREYRLAAYVILGIFLILVASSLSFTTMRLRKTRDMERCLMDKVQTAIEDAGSNWDTSIVIARENGGKYSADVYIRGAPPFPDPTSANFAREVDSDEVCGADELEIYFQPELNIDLNVV